MLIPPKRVCHTRAQGSRKRCHGLHTAIQFLLLSQETFCLVQPGSQLTCLLWH
jgi:hypothetical protein